MDLYTTLEPYSQPTAKETLHLIELNDDILATINGSKGGNKANNKLYLKSSGKSSYPVLVTNEKTYKIRKQNHSNCVMLLSESNGGGYVSHKSFSDQLVLSETQPILNLFDVPALQSLTQLDRTEVEIPTNKSGRLTEDLIFKNSSCSKTQFEYLKIEHLLITIPNHGCFVLGEGIVRDCLKVLLEWVVEQMTDDNEDIMNELHFQECVNGTLNQQVKKQKEEELDLLFPVEVIRAVIKKYSTYSPPSGSEECDNGDQVVELKDDQIIRLFGTLLLRGKIGLINIDDFLISLKLELPFGYRPDIRLDYLKGVYAIDGAGNGKSIRYLNENDLSMDLSKRFKELFGIKREWLVDEIEPFVQRFNTKKLKVDKFLIKFVKVRKVGKKIVVSSR